MERATSYTSACDHFECGIDDFSKCRKNFDEIILRNEIWHIVYNTRCVCTFWRYAYIVDAKTLSGILPPVLYGRVREVIPPPIEPILNNRGEDRVDVWVVIIDAKLLSEVVRDATSGA